MIKIVNIIQILFKYPSKNTERGRERERNTEQERERSILREREREKYTARMIS